MDTTFPPIASTGNIITPYITPRTIAYIHARIVNSITLYPSNAQLERELGIENMVLDVLNEMSPEAFR